jgi:hypothetical protein
MSFAPIDLEFDGVSYPVPANRVLGLIAAIEEHITLNELVAFTESPKRAKLAYAWAAALTYANTCTGKPANPALPALGVLSESVYLGTFAHGEEGANNMLHTVISLVTSLLPPKEITEKLETLGEGQGGKKPKTKPQRS